MSIIYAKIIFLWVIFLIYKKNKNKLNKEQHDM